MSWIFQFAFVAKVRVTDSICQIANVLFTATKVIRLASEKSGKENLADSSVTTQCFEAESEACQPKP